MSKLTLESVAKLAGVSRSTVSRVINNHPNVKQEVRERVLQVVAETGYLPDPAARSLASRRSGIIGLIIPHAVQSVFDDPYFPRLIQGISQACNNKDHILSLFLFQTIEDEIKLLPRMIRNQIFDGAIVADPRENNPIMSELIKYDVPFVLIGRNDNPAVNFVDADNFSGAYTAVSHLIRAGRKRIATITGPLANMAAVDRKQGYIKALQDRGHAIDNALIHQGDYTEISGYHGMLNLLAHQPDAVFVASDTMALGALRALRDRNISVPEQVAIIGFDDMPYAATADPPLTTIRQTIRRAGGLAVETLMDILENGSSPARRIVMPTELVIRASSENHL